MWMLKGAEAACLGTGRVTLFRGKGLGLELVFAGREFRDAFEELEARLAERPDFYRGSSATINFGGYTPSSNEREEVRSLLARAGIELLEASDAEGPAPGSERGELDRRRARRSRGELLLSDGARSLVADFAGARADIADRRRRGEASVRRAVAEGPPSQTVLHLVEASPGTLYHDGTLRGGQALHHTGNIVVVGDVNPGAELVATGDIVIFGRLAGVAHAGAQGDESARVYAIDLRPTQLRIATFIAAEAESVDRSVRPQAAFVQDGRITLVPFDRFAELEERGAKEL
jgi:septum site-determining protein MinC